MDSPRRDWIAFHAARRPAAPALADTAGRIAYSYAALDARIAEAAGALLAEPGMAPGERICVLAGNAPETLVLLHACERVGAVLCPLNTRLAPAELAAMAAFLDPVLILHDAAAAAVAATLTDAAPRAALRSLGPDYGRGAPPARAVPGPETRLSMILFTSGTTGRPKAVMLTPRMHRINAVNMALGAEIDGASRHLSVLPMYHSAGFNLYAQPVLFMGGTVVVAPGFDAAETLAWLGDPARGITHFFAVPTAYRLLADRPGFGRADFRHLRVAGVGGAPLPPALFARCAEAGLLLLQGHGMTECGPSLFAMDRAHARLRPGSVGRPLLHVEAMVQRPDGSPAADGEQGDIVVRGEALTPGYWRNPEATAALYRDGWLVTGDVGRRDADDFFHIDGRRSQMIISGGEKIAPAEVEALLGSHPQVEEVALVGVPDPVWGEVGHAYVVPRPGARPDAAALRAFCTGRIARYKIPQGVTLLEALPRNEMGKIDRSRLPAP